MASCGFCKSSGQLKLKSCVCQKMSYCSKECQTKDWKSHKPSCPPFILRGSPGKGMGLFATRKIKMGQVILEEYPLVTVRAHWSKADLLARATAAARAMEAGKLDVTGCADPPFMNYHELKTDFYPSIDETTKAKLFLTHDPAENLQGLDTKTVKKLRHKNPDGWLTEDAKGEDEVSKIWRILSCYSDQICGEKILYRESMEDGDRLGLQGELVNPLDDGLGLYFTMTHINHACVPNAVHSYVMGDIKKHQLRALMDIEKDQEILVSYMSEKICYDSRDCRREKLWERFVFLCSCSECSLEGEALDINEGLRAKLRQIIAKKLQVDQLLSPYGASNSAPPRELVKKSMKLTQKRVKLVQKLDLRDRFVTAMVNSYGLASIGQSLDNPIPNEKEIYKQEALKYAKMFGDCFIHAFYRYSFY